jgi:arsenite methyltransferase
MLDKARHNAKKGDYSNVEFRLGEIENLPVANDSVDLIISNCVINLSDNKPRVFAEAFRVLRPGGKVLVSDIVLFGEIPKEVKDSVAAYVGCFSGAIIKDEYLEIMKSKGFVDVEVVEEAKLDFSSVANDPSANVLSRELGLTSTQIADLMKAVLSVKIVARKP